MRKLLPVLASLLAVACGDGSSDNNHPGGPLTGTVGGRAFTPTDVRALVVGTGATACSVQGLTFGAQGLALEITSYANACGDFANASCTYHQNAQSVTVLIAKLNPVPPYTQPTVSPGTYTFKASPADVGTPDVSGQLTVAYAQAIATDATCNGNAPTPAPSVAGGTLRLDSVAGPVTGHISVTFQGGGSLTGDFSAPLCTETPSVCGLAAAGAICTSAGASCVP